MMRSINLAILGAALFGGGNLGVSRADAGVITYTESAVGTGALGTSSFVGALVTVTFVGDTANITGSAPFF